MSSSAKKDYPIDLKEYTRAEVSKHNKIDDLWIIVDGYVYDVTSMVFEHPGGESAFLDHAGKDGTKAYKVVYNHEYPENQAMLKSLLRGRITETSKSSGDNNIDDMHEADMLHADVGHSTQSGPPHVLFIMGAVALGGFIIRLLF